MNQDDSSGWNEASAVEAFRTAIGRLDDINPCWRDDLGVASHFNNATAEHYRPAKAKVCVYPDCDQVPVQSHVLSKGAALRPLAENGLVITPRILSPHDVRFVRRSIASASTLPLYCIEHERIFHGFEQAGALTLPSHYVLQLMRSAAREMVRLEKHRKWIRQITSLYRQAALHDGAGALERTKLEDALRPLSALDSSAAINLSRVTQVHNDLVSQAAANSLPSWIFATSVESTLEVALSAWTFVHPEGAPSCAVVMVVIPSGPSRSLVLCCSSSDDAGPLERYVQSYLVTHPIREGTVSQWLGIDNWYARPQWWERQSQDFRDLVKSRLLSL